MNVLLILPVVIPLTAAAVSLLAWRWRAVQRGLGLVGAAALFGAALLLFGVVWRHGIQAVQLGNWPAPFGITFVADVFSAVMLVLAGLMGVVVVVYSFGSVDPRRESFGYYPLLQVLLAGVCGAFLTGDVFNLYVWFEVMLIASFVLLALGGERAQLEGAVKYVTLNLISSAFFLTAVGILYGIAGTLNMADLSRVLSAGTRPGLTGAVAMLFVVAFGIKAAVFPLFFWLPASYHTPPVAVTAIFSGLLTKVGVYALMRVFTLLFAQEVGYTHTLLLVIAGLTMVTGVLGAVAQSEFRRLLSFHIVSQIGYLLMGLGLFTPLALAGAVFFMAHVIVAKSALFLVSGIAHRLAGTYELKNLGGLYQAYPGLALLFVLPAFSLAGIPPLSGFWAKLALVRAGLEAEQYVIVATALGVSLLTLFSMTKIWAEVFWKERPAGGQSTTARGPHPPPLAQFSLLCPTAVLAACTVVLGLAAEPFLVVALRAAEQLLHPAGYVRAVLGGPP
ncbi:MAG: Na+/H+ antiporter subunit D [Thermodesulfobacteriota bacterium]|jgi:multicomponent Na+:H+ antiporter subunit D